MDTVELVSSLTIYFLFDESEIFSGSQIDCGIKKQGNYPEQEQYNENYVALGRCSTSSSGRFFQFNQNTSNSTGLYR